MYEETNLFAGGENGYHTFRIPVLLTSKKGTILAFCEARKHSQADSGDIDIALRRSFDNGQTWDPMRIIVDNGPNVAGNPAPVMDRETGIIWMLFCKNLAEGPESMIVEGKAPRTVWVTSSADDGTTWAEPKEITKDVKDPSWTWYATGPCHGIQLQSGRLVIPCDHVAGPTQSFNDVESSVAPLSESGYSHIIYSDDHGKSWHIGGIAQKGTNESVIVQTIDGALYFNCRNYVGEKRRAYAWSLDDGESFTKPGWDDTLLEPICQASMIRFTDENSHDKNRILFSNPASDKRECLTVRLSYDECQTWNTGKVLHQGHSDYSDLCIASDMSICCLYGSNNYKFITLARFDLEWLTDGADTLG